MRGSLVCFLIVLKSFNEVSGSYCDNITQKYSPEKHYVSVGGTIKDVHLYWGSDPARAASALFATFVRYGLGYQNVYLHRGSHSLQTLAAKAQHNPSRKYKEAILALSTAWVPSPPPDWVPEAGNVPGLAGPRFDELGASVIPARQQLLAYLAADYRDKDACVNVVAYNFYANLTALKLCGFLQTTASVAEAVVYELDSNDDKIGMELKRRAQITEQYFQYKTINRSVLFQLLRKSNTSFLFLDYDIWTEYSYVKLVQPPPCIPDTNNKCDQELDNVVSMSIGDVFTFEEYAPHLLQAAIDFKPSVRSIRNILQLEDYERSIEENACEWAWKNINVLNGWIEKYKNSTKEYEILVFTCNDDPDIQNYYDILKYLDGRIKYRIGISNSELSFRWYQSDCSDIHSVSNSIDNYMEHSLRQRLLGAIVDGKNLREIAKKVDGRHFPVMLYDAPDVNADLTKCIWLSTGTYYHVALAIDSFMSGMKWTRFAILSEPSETGQSFVDEIENVMTKKTRYHHYRDHAIPVNKSRENIISLLNQLQNEEARIILVNTNHKDAIQIISTAEQLEMNSAEDYVWIVREWAPCYSCTKIQPISFSFFSRSDLSNPRTGGKDGINYYISNHTSRGYRWKAKARALSDAVYTMVAGFRDMLPNNPQFQNDLQRGSTLREFQKSITKLPINATQKLVYKGRSLEQTMVFVEKWQGAYTKILATYKINATVNEVCNDSKLSKEYSEYEKVGDGSKRCLIKFGSPYLPNCYDWELVSGIFFLILTISGLIAMYRLVQRYEKRRAHKNMLDLIMQRKQNVDVISGYLVERSSLIMTRELGAGQYGSVRLGELKIPGRITRIVAAKSLRKDQDEREIVKEACILASLNSNHIIRLIGVCIDDLPTLLLMEFAFFGDLLKYLRERWYLADGALSDSGICLDKVDDEAVHVSGQSLTRMAREAASALAYISLHGVIHRDIRAANYLVDANRSLKLADFGLARKIVPTGADGGAEYASLRHGLFPVLTMAPECLTHGIFSSASDVWSYGVLVFELVTLGARPYGNMSLQDVKDFVSNGGQPSMPYDSTLHTIELVNMCFKRIPEQRPTAAEIVTYLEDKPCALRAAFKCDYDMPKCLEYDISSTHPLLMS